MVDCKHKWAEKPTSVSIKDIGLNKFHLMGLTRCTLCNQNAVLDGEVSITTDPIIHKQIEKIEKAERESVKCWSCEHYEAFFDSSTTSCKKNEPYFNSVDRVTLLATSTADTINTMATTLEMACQFFLKLIEEHCLTCDFYYRNYCSVNAYHFCFNKKEVTKRSTYGITTPLAQRFYDTHDLWGIIRAHLRKHVEQAKDLEPELKDVTFKVNLPAIDRETNWDEVLSLESNLINHEIVLEYTTPDRQVISKKYLCTIKSITTEDSIIEVSAIESEEPAVVKGKMIRTSEDMKALNEED
jgi:hypothetical protein